MGRPLKTIEKVFESEFIVIDLSKEYTDYTGKIQWAITSKLPENELREKYSELLEPYFPFIYLTHEQGWIIIEDQLRANRLLKDQIKYECAFGYDSVEEAYHSDFAVPDYPTSCEHGEYEEYRREERHILFKAAIDSLSPAQRSCFDRKYIRNLTEVDIAEEDGITRQSVCNQIAKAKRKFYVVFKDFYRL